MMTSDDNKIGSVYVSWGTFKNAIEELAQGVPPNKIDRSVFPGLAWSIQNQLFTGFRFLGLIDGESCPTEELEALAVPDEEQRKTVLGTVLKKRYGPLFSLDLKKTTPGELSKQIEEVYGLTGQTRDRAYRFFVNAAQYANIELSSHVANRRVRMANGQKRRKSAKHEVPDTAVQQPPTTPTNGTSRTVALRSGGTLTISASLDLFALGVDDRKFVFALIDKLEEYETVSAKTETPASAATAERA